MKEQLFRGEVRVKFSLPYIIKIIEPNIICWSTYFTTDIFQSSKCLSKLGILLEYYAQFYKTFNQWVLSLYSGLYQWLHFNAWIFNKALRWQQFRATNKKSSKENNKPCVDALQGWGEKCCLLNEGAPTAVWPCKYTGLPEILVAKLVKAVMEDKQQFVIQHQLS